MTAPSASWSASRADARVTAGAVVLACALFVASWLILHVDRFEPFQIVDTGVYQRYGDAMTAGQLPYRDFRLEYPPGALPMFVLPSLAGKDAYRDVFEPIMLALGLVLSGLLVMTLARAGAGPRRLYLAAAFVGVAPLAVGTAVLTRFDLWPAVLLAGALAALAHERARLGLGLLAVAISAKLYPAVVAPIALAYVWHRRGRREALVAGGVLVAVLLAIFLPFAILSPDGMRYAFERQTGRPLQLESTGAAILHAAHGLGLYEPTVENGFGSQNLTGDAADTLATLSTALQAILLVGIWVAFAVGRRGVRPRVDDLLLASAAAVTAFIAFGKVLSPQYMVWLFALAPVVAGRRGVVAAGLALAAFALTHAWFPGRYWDVVDLQTGPAWLVVARDLALVALVVVLVTAIRPGREAARTR